MKKKQIKMTDLLIEHLFAQDGISTIDEYSDSLEKSGYDPYIEVLISSTYLSSKK